MPFIRKPERPEDRLIVALDYNKEADALRLMDELAGTVHFCKVGLELFVTGGPQIVRALQERNLKVFLDLKMDDVGETIERAVRQFAAMKVQFLTILGGGATADAAIRGKADSDLSILQVTFLTSLGEDDLRDMLLLGPDKRFQSVEEYVLWRAKGSLTHGCEGLISSGQNAAMLRSALGGDFLLVCPGIRPPGAQVQDHKRPATPRSAVEDGADYLVVGRPIRDADDPKGAAEMIIEDIAKARA